MNHKEIFNYCERNLVKLFVYISSPYVKIYILDEAVVIEYI